MSQSKADILRRVSVLAIDDPEGASRHLQEHYGFMPGSARRESISPNVSMRVFVQDGFLDCYSGDRLVNPGALRALSELLPKTFPYHRHGDRTQSHIAYWELRATVDHLAPLGRDGPHDLDNFRTTSMLRNLAKSNSTISQLGWEDLRSKGRLQVDLNEWDGLSQWLLDVTERHPTLLSIPLIRTWHSATRRVLP